MRSITLILLLFVNTFILMSCASSTGKNLAITSSVEQFTLPQADRLAELPLKCIQTPYPYKAGHVVSGAKDERSHLDYHPAFFGCFDWHSAVHGHWSLVYLLKQFPDLNRAAEARQMLSENLSAEHIATEIDYFSLNRYTGSFERTYGWAWLLKLYIELASWDDVQAQQLANNLQPLAQLVSEKYIQYLPRLRYPIRVGEHTNTAFGLSFAYDYAQQINDQALAEMIRSTARTFYANDTKCPIAWEPGGYDFLSPCLEEMRLMKKILPDSEFNVWLEGFLPGFDAGGFQLEPGEIIDRTDGKLVHLDGLNFSRAWSLYPVAGSPVVKQMADRHFSSSFARITDGDYSGEHWLASFALYALQERQRMLNKTDSQ